MLVEEILGLLVIALQQFEIGGWRKRQNRAKPLATRTVACHRLVDVDINVKLDGTALATTVITTNSHSLLALRNGRAQFNKLRQLNK